MPGLAAVAFLLNLILLAPVATCLSGIESSSPSSTNSNYNAAVAAANKLSCNFNERHCCDFTMQGWRVASEGSMRLVCAFSNAKPGELSNQITVEGPSSLHLCLQVHYRLQKQQQQQRQQQQQQSPPLSLLINDEQVWSVDWPSIGRQDSASSSLLNSTSLAAAVSPDWQVSLVSISLRPSATREGSRRHTITVRGLDGVCLDALLADSGGRCPVTRQPLLWLLLDQRMWLAVCLCLMGICLISGLVASVLLSRRKGSGMRGQETDRDGGAAVVGPRVRAQPVRLSQLLLSSPAPPLRRQSSQLHRQHPYHHQHQHQQQQQQQQHSNPNRLSVQLQHHRTPSNGSGNFPLPETVPFRSARPISVPPGCTFLLGSAAAAAAPTAVEPLVETVESPGNVDETMASTLPRRPAAAQMGGLSTVSTRPLSSTFVPAGVGGFGYALGSRPLSSISGAAVGAAAAAVDADEAGDNDDGASPGGNISNNVTTTTIVTSNNDASID